MPSVSNSTSETSVQAREGSFRTGEMEDLMRRITDSLRLKASCKQKAQHVNRAIQRPTPYNLPTTKKTCLKFHEQYKMHRKTDSTERERRCSDPRKLLQELLRERSLIAEAVKRLQFKTETFSEAADKRKNWSYADDVYEENVYS